MAAAQMDRAACWRAMAEGRQRAGAARARHRDHRPLCLSGPAEVGEALEAVAARQGSQRPAQAPRNQEHDHRPPLDPRAARSGPEPREARRLGGRSDVLPAHAARPGAARAHLAAHPGSQAGRQECRRDRGHAHGRLERLAPELKSSITFDKPRQEASGSIPERTEASRPRRGSEFARHGLLASVSGMTTWFCDAYASWQKGSVENTNGRLRRQLPRHLDLDTLSQADLQEIVLSLKLTPRKCLGYATPIQAFFKGLGKDIQIRFA